MYSAYLQSKKCSNLLCIIYTHCMLNKQEDGAISSLIPRPSVCNESLGMRLHIAPDYLHAWYWPKRVL